MFSTWSRIGLASPAVIPGSVGRCGRDGTDLDGANFRSRNPGGDLDRVVQVARLDHIEAAQLLFGLGEGAVGRRDFPVADPDAGRRMRGFESVPADIVTALLDAVAEFPVFTHHRV